MAESNQISRLSHTHEAIMNWMLLNPGESLRACADHFQITQSWLSTVIHSDIFQAQLAQRNEGIRCRVAEAIPKKMQIAADIGLDKLATKIEESENPDFILDATDKLLHRLGYAPQKVPTGPGIAGQPGTQNNFFISAGDLAEARGLMNPPVPQPEALPGESVRVKD